MTSTPEPADAATSDETAAVDAPEAAARETEASETVAPVAADERLIAAHDLALAALGEITPLATVGDPVDYVVEPDGVVSLRFANRLAGYPGWLWTVSVAVVPDAEPTVLEVELLPAAGALLAPDWVPWAVRLAEYQAAQAAAQDDVDDEDDEADADLDDDADLDEDDDVDDESFADGSTAVTHAGDVDGVDIDALDAGASDGTEDDEDDEDDESDEDDDESDHDESLWER